jgi:hypothetical protein
MTAILIPGLSIAAYCDEILLTNGRTLVGISREESGRVIVEMNFGTVGIPRAEVQSIVPGRTLLHDYQDYASALDICPDASSLFDLALWAKAHGLTRYVDGLLQRTIALDPEHEQARKMLGFVCYQGSWMTGFELRKALGWVEFRGIWVAPNELNVWCTLEANPCGAAQAGRSESHAKRVHAQPEGVSYSLGFPPYKSRGTHNCGYGGYSIWGGAVPTHNLMNLPVIQTRMR